MKNIYVFIFALFCTTVGYFAWPMHQVLEKYLEFETVRIIAGPFFVLSLSLLAVSAVLFFASDQIFRSWIRFAVWWMGISIALIAILPTDSDGGTLGTGDILDKGPVSLVVAVGFFLVSLIIIVYQSVGSSRSGGKALYK